MGSPLRRGFVGRVSGWSPSTPEFTPQAQTSIFVPHGLRLRQTITSSGAVTIPAGIEWVYAIMTGGGQTQYFGSGGGAAEVCWGWTPAAATCVIGAGGQPGSYSRYGHLLALGGANQSNPARANFYGMPGGAQGTNGGPGKPGAYGGIGASDTRTVGANGGDGISGGIPLVLSITGDAAASHGGSGLVGSGGAQSNAGAGTKTGGNGGNGLGVDGTVYTGGTGFAVTNGANNGNGGGGAGMAASGQNATQTASGNGGLGGGGGGAGGTGGAGGDGILYLYY